MWEIEREGERASVKREAHTKTRYTDCVVRLGLLLHPHKHSNTANTHTRTYLDPDLISNEYIYISKSKVRKYLLVLLNRKKVSKSK